MFQKSKRGDERVLGFYWMIIFVLIAVAIVAATISFYSFPLDVRQGEARILGDKIIDCMSEQGKLVDGINDLEKDCNLNFEDERYDKNQFYVSVEGYEPFDEDDSQDFLAYCLEKPSANIPVCYETKFFVLDGEDNIVLLYITVAIRKIEQNAK